MKKNEKVKDNGNGNEEVKDTKSIGEMIGKVRKHFSITNEHKEKVKMSLVYDFTGTSDQDIITWLTGNRVIASQNGPLRKLTKDELEELDGSVVIAHHASRAIESRADKVKAYMDMGFPKDLSERMVDDPELFEKAKGLLASL